MTYTPPPEWPLGEDGIDPYARMMRVMLIGPQGAGKTTLANALVEDQKGTGAARISLADALREEVARTVATQHGRFQIDEYYRILYEMQQPHLKAKWRHLLQYWGSEVRRAEDLRYWIIELADRQAHLIKFNLNDPYTTYIVQDRVPVFIDDVRFQNEYDYLKLHGFVAIGLTDAKNEYRPSDDHQSEQEWPNLPVIDVLPWMPISDRVVEVNNIIARVGWKS